MSTVSARTTDEDRGARQVAGAAAAFTSRNFDTIARFYDQDYREYADDIEAVVDLARAAGGPCLELGCGTGRLLVPVATAGCTVTGVDFSPGLLAVAREKLTGLAASDHVLLYEADLRTFSLLQKEFAFAFCVSNTLMHLTTQADQLAALRRGATHLQPGGQLLLDLFNPDVKRLTEVAGLQELADVWEDPVSGARVVKWSVRTVYWAEQIQETTFVYEEIFPDGRVAKTTCTFPLRFLWRGELELMLPAAGLEIEALWGDFDGTPYDDASEHMVVLARKP